jgi:phosphoribosylformimino-5-aminoimidazole carboxamide ribotide isomerase
VKFIPAIDLKNNKCVRLKKGNKENITVFNENPVDQAKYFEQSGCERIHIVDLDGAFGNTSINKSTIINIRKNISIPIELGGGIKNQNNISFWINEGIDFLVIGSLAVKNKEAVKEILALYKNKIYIALDILNNKIMIKGWVEDSDLNVDDILNYYNDLSIKGFILTDISRDGMLSGLDIDLINDIILKTKKNIIVGGGLSNYEDLYKLIKIKRPNLEGVIAGKSFYSGNIEIKKSLEIVRLDA